MDWDLVSKVIGTVGGLVGLLFGSIGIWLSCKTHNRQSAEHAILLRRTERELNEQAVTDRADELRRAAYESAVNADSASTVLVISIKLQDELDKKAAWKLAKKRLANMQDETVEILVSKDLLGSF